MGRAGERRPRAGGLGRGLPRGGRPRPARRPEREPGRRRAARSPARSAAPGRPRRRARWRRAGGPRPRAHFKCSAAAHWRPPKAPAELGRAIGRRRPRPSRPAPAPRGPNTRVAGRARGTGTVPHLGGRRSGVHPAGRGPRVGPGGSRPLCGHPRAGQGRATHGGTGGGRHPQTTTVLRAQPPTLGLARERLPRLFSRPSPGRCSKGFPQLAAGVEGESRPPPPSIHVPHFGSKSTSRGLFEAQRVNVGGG